MPVFETKDDVVLFFETLAKCLKDKCIDSAFEVNINMVAICRENVKAIMESYQTCQRAVEKKVQPVKGVIKK